MSNILEYPLKKVNNDFSVSDRLKKYSINPYWKDMTTLWDVMSQSMPAFCTWKKYPEPQWSYSRNITTHAKHWILFFWFMGKMYTGYSSDMEQSLHFLQSIQEPA